MRINEIKQKRDYGKGFLKRKFLTTLPLSKREGKKQQDEIFYQSV